MARLSRVVVPDLPHHVIQRGARRMRTFFRPEDFQLYLLLLARHAQAAEVAIWAYCLMPNHVHFIAVPSRPTSLARLCRGLHSQYAALVNAREGWSGHLWQQRYSSFPMDAQHTRAALSYILLNPVRAGLVATPLDWGWSSAGAHLGTKADPVLGANPVQLAIDASQLAESTVSDRTSLERLRSAIRSGRPLGSATFLRALEERLGRVLRPRRPGRKSLKSTAAGSPREA